MADNRTLHKYLFEAGVDHLLTEVTGEARTASAAAESLGVEPGKVVKSLVCVAGDDTVIALVPGDRELSLARLAVVLGVPDVRLASRRVVERTTGYRVGGVAPLAHSHPLPVWGDDSLRLLEVVFCGGGTPHHLLRIGVRDLERLAGVRWARLTDGPRQRGTASAVEDATTHSKPGSAPLRADSTT